MKDRKKLYIIVGVAVAILFIAILSFLFFSDKNKLTKKEKMWISDNLSTVQTINIINDINVFGDNGSGVYYDFLKDFQTEYRIEINPVTFHLGEETNGNTFTAGNKIEKNDTVFYEDHYALISKNSEIIVDYNQVSGKKIGVLNTDKEYILNSLKSYNLVEQESIEKIYESLKNDSIDYALVPIIRDIDLILTNDFHINYHFSDIKYYFFFKGEKNNTLASIMKKYFNKWEKKYLKGDINDNMLIAYKVALNINDAQISQMLGKTYNYGFINQNPYEVITGGNFGGIVAVYLKDFSDFSGVEFKFKKYRNFEKFESALANSEVDLYFNYYEYANKFNETLGNGHITGYIIAPLKSDMTITNLDTLNGKTVYAQAHSKIAKYLETKTSVNLKLYDTQKEMLKLAKKDKIIAIDESIYSYYHKNKLSDYEMRYSFELAESYNFKTKDNGAFNKLLGRYIESLDYKTIKYQGLENHRKTMFKGTLLGKLAKYFMVILAGIVVFMTFFYKKSKKIKIAKKIKNDERIKFIDILTSLKNRNYLKENMDAWNNNKIYPQTMIVIDLNSIQYLNDTKGYEAGDKQITSLANILIKTQLDNSDIMRTNGNEFLIYLVGYQQKYIANYIHKLTKEMKKLPYEYGAAIGYSMITDDIKTIEDAINEAIEDMKKQKPSSKEGRK